MSADMVGGGQRGVCVAKSADRQIASDGICNAVDRGVSAKDVLVTFTLATFVGRRASHRVRCTVLVTMHVGILAAEREADELVIRVEAKEVF